MLKTSDNPDGTEQAVFDKMAEGMKEDRAKFFATNIWNDFLFGVAFSGADSKPITVGLNNMVNTTSSVKNYNVDMAAAVIAGLPTILIYVLAGKFFVKGLTAGAVKG